MRRLITMIPLLWATTALGQNSCNFANAAGVWSIYGSGLGRSHMQVMPAESGDDNAEITWHYPNGISHRFGGNYHQDAIGNCVLTIDVILPGAVMVAPVDGPYDIAYQPASYPSAIPVGTPIVSACELARPYWVTDAENERLPSTVDGPYGHGEVTSYGGGVYLGANEVHKGVCEYWGTTQATYLAIAWITGYCVNKGNGVAVNASNCEGIAPPQEDFYPTPTRVQCSWPLDSAPGQPPADESSDHACLVHVDADPVTGAGGVPIAQGEVYIQRSSLY